MEWINVWRNTIPKFIATVNLILNEKKIDSNHNSNNETIFNLCKTLYLVLQWFAK